MFNVKRKTILERPLSLLNAKEVAAAVYRNRHGIVTGRDSDGNIVIVRYPDGIVDEAAQAASLAPNMSASIDEIERVFTTAELRISSAVHTS